MSYSVKKTTNNGYRCSCCTHQWDDTEWYDDRVEALAQCPITHVGQPEYELVAVEVIDGSNGDTIAEGTLTWHGTRSQKYQFERWYGHVDGIAFDEVRGGNQGETWAQLIVRVNTERAAQKVADAERVLAAAQRDLDAARTAAQS